MRLARRRFPCQYTVPMGRQTAGLEGNGQAAVRPPAVLASAATGIVEDIERQGGDVEGVFASAAIAPSVAGAPTLRLRLASFCALFEGAARSTGNDNFGLWFGNSFRPRDLGMRGYSAISAQTLGCAIENLVELFPLHQESSLMRLVAGNSLGRLEYQITAPSILERRQDAELSLGMFLNVFRECLGPGGSRRRSISSTHGQRVSASMNGPSAPRSISRKPPTPSCSAPKPSTARCPVATRR